MTSKTRSLRDFRNPIGCLVLLAAFAAAAGCSTAESPGGSSNNMNHVLPSGSSVAGWLVVPSGGTHASSATLDYIGNGGSSGCTQCHGSDLPEGDGGISGVSCFNETSGCHHPAGWDSPGNHGKSAKQPPESGSFFACQICHGNNFRSPLGEEDWTCYSCHTSAPHPPDWLPGDKYVHTTTNPANAPVCAQCHRNSNPGTPGCFNNTLCHAEGPPHVLGSTWVNPTSNQFHGLTAKQNLSYCQGCHGTPGTTLFNGGSAPTSCQASCHTQAKAHPIPWYQAPGAFPNYVSSHRNSGNRSVACAICHKVDGAGTGPDPNAPSCFSASFDGVSCHPNGPGEPNHSVPNLDTTHTTATQTTFSADCGNCHATTGSSPVSSAPACDSCHTNFAARSPLVYKDCSSCHADGANGPSGTAYPNVAGAHAKHLALNTPSNPNGTPVNCNTCHNTLNPATGVLADRQNHYARAKSQAQPGDVVFLSTYNAQSGASSFVPSLFTCADVRCHGGTAPNWRTSAIDPLANCTICHKSSAVAPAQYNDYYSGEHSRHINKNIACTECHDMSSATLGGQNHFKYLFTTSLRDLGVTTVSSTFRSATGITYTPPSAIPGTGRCSGTCHGEVHDNVAWSIPR